MLQRLRRVNCEFACPPPSRMTGGVFAAQYICTAREGRHDSGHFPRGEGDVGYPRGERGCNCRPQRGGDHAGEVFIHGGDPSGRRLFADRLGLLSCFVW